MANKTGTQLKALAESYTEADTITDANALLWINEFLMNNLRGNAGIKASQNFVNSTRLTKYPLPATFITEYKVEEYTTSVVADTDFYREYSDYTIEDDKISFNTDGHYKLSYFILPTELATIGTAMTVNQVFDKPCALWIAHRHLTNDDEDNAKNQTLGQLRLMEYVSEFQRSINDRMKLFKKRRRIRRGI